MDEITEGYRDGFADDRADLPETLANRSQAYCFGWLNGRDDRISKPRATAAELRRELAIIAAAMSSEKGGE